MLKFEPAIGLSRRLLPFCGVLAVWVYPSRTSGLLERRVDPLNGSICGAFPTGLVFAGGLELGRLRWCYAGARCCIMSGRVNAQAQLVEYLSDNQLIKTARVRKAMLAVDRRHFVPEEYEMHAYAVCQLMQLRMSCLIGMFGCARLAQHRDGVFPPWFEFPCILCGQRSWWSST